jgi:hypothetical protein
VSHVENLDPVSIGIFDEGNVPAQEGAEKESQQDGT